MDNARNLNNTLKRLDFNVTLHTDQDKPIIDLVTNFTEKISNGDLVLFYFCGHGYRVNGKNYLIPNDDAKIRTVTDVQKFGVNVKSIIRAFLPRNSANAMIFIFDCSKSYLLQNVETETS